MRYVVAVTGCVSGVAHTYMAAERLEKLAQQEGWRIKVETQGALGIENPLTAEDIAQADAVVLVADIELRGVERFLLARTVKTAVGPFLRDPAKAMAAVRRVMATPQHTHITLD